MRAYSRHFLPLEIAEHGKNIFLMFSGEAPLICFLFPIKTQQNKKIEKNIILTFFFNLANMNVTVNIAILFHLYLSFFIIKLFFHVALSVVYQENVIH